MKNLATKLLFLPFALLAAISLRSAPQDQTFHSDFDSGDVEMLGEGDDVAAFSVGDVGTLGIPRLYSSGSFAWMVQDGMTGEIEFSRPAAVVEFFAGVQTSGDGELRIFDGSDTQVETITDLPTDISSGNALSFSPEGGVSRIEFENLSGNGSNRVVLDDFGFTPAEEMAPEFELEPVSTTTRTGGRAQFFAVAAGDVEATYQWKKDGAEIAGATSSSLVIRDVSAADEGFYSVVATVDGASAESSPAALTIDDAAEAAFANLSTRARVGTGADVVIPGLVISGDLARTALVRAVGPDLEERDVPGFLEDPELTVFSGQTPLFSNDDWGDFPDQEELANVSDIVGADPLAEGSRDAAAVVTLNPGPFTVLVSGVGATSGVALVEVFILPLPADE